MRFVVLFPAVVALLVATPLNAQVVSGVVVDSLTGRPVPSAAVSWETESGATTVAADGEGRFELHYRGDAPDSLWVSALGYLDRAVGLSPAALEARLRIALREAPVELEGVGAEVERDDSAWKFGGFFVTDEGLVRGGRLGCAFVMVDSVIVKNQEFLKPEVWRNHERALQWMRAVVKNYVLSNGDIADPRLKADAWPCGFYRPYRQRRALRFHPTIVSYFDSFPEPPTPQGTPVRLDVDEGLRLPALAPCPGNLAVGPEGATAFITRRPWAMHVIEPDGTVRWSIQAGLDETPMACPLRVGWTGDRVWIVDAEQERVSVIGPDGTVEARTPDQGLPSRQRWDDSERTMPASPTATDLALPVPAADGHWFWTIPAPDPPTPPIHSDDPPGRLLLALTDAWAMHRVLTPLRPGVKQVDLVLGDAPVLGPQPFRDHPLYALDPAGRHITLVEREHQMAAWMTAYRVTRFDLNADTVFHTERRALMAEVSDEVVEAAAAELAAHPGALAAIPDIPGTEDPPASRRALVRGLLYKPPFLPSVSDVVVGHDGTTWLRWPDTHAPLIRWEVLDETGTAIRTFELERDVRIVAADGDRVWAVRDVAPGLGSELFVLRVEQLSDAIPEENR